MDPVTLSAIMAGGSSLLGMLEGNSARKQEMAIAMQNLALQQRAADRQWQIAQDTMEMQKAGTRDAEGNETRYIPGVGWVSTADPRTKAVIDASRAEQLKRLTEDAALGRENLRQDFARRGREGAMADTTMTEWKQDDTPDVNTLRHAILAQKMQGLDRGFDQESRNSMRQANRSSSSNVGNIVSALASRRAEANADARSSSYLDALTTRQGMQGARDTRLGNKYNLLAGRSTGGQPDFTPDNTNAQLLAGLQANRNLSPQAAGVAGNLAGSYAQNQYQPKPNYGPALALGGAGQLLSALMDRRQPTTTSYNSGSAGRGGY